MDVQEQLDDFVEIKDAIKQNYIDQNDLDEFKNEISEKYHNKESIDLYIKQINSSINLNYKQNYNNIITLDNTTKDLILKYDNIYKKISNVHLEMNQKYNNTNDALHNDIRLSEKMDEIDSKNKIIQQMQHRIIIFKEDINDKFNLILIKSNKNIIDIIHINKREFVGISIITNILYIIVIAYILYFK